MKKIVLSLAMAFAAAGAYAQSTADDGTIRTSDAVQINGSVTMYDMIDLVPEYQIAYNTASTWNDYNNGLQLNENGGFIPNPPPSNNPSGAIEMRVSATRPFKVAVKSTQWLRVGNNAPSGVVTSFPAEAFSLTGMPSPEMVGTPGGANTAYPVNGQWIGAWGNVAASTQSNAVPLTNSDVNFLSADGCYNRQFDLALRLRPGYGYNHQGTYLGIVTLTASLN